MLGRLQIDGGRQMGLPELPSLRKGTAPGIVPRVNLIAQSYAWLHVALATGSSDRSLAGMQPHVPGELLSVCLPLCSCDPWYWHLGLCIDTWGGICPMRCCYINPTPLWGWQR